MSGSIGSSLSLLGPLLTQLLSSGNQSMSLSNVFGAVSSDNGGNDSHDLMSALLSMVPDGLTPLNQVKIDPQPPMSLTDLVSLNPIPTSQGLSIDDTGMLAKMFGMNDFANMGSQNNSTGLGGLVPGLIPGRSSNLGGDSGTDMGQYTMQLYNRIQSTGMLPSVQELMNNLYAIGGNLESPSALALSARMNAVLSSFGSAGNLRAEEFQAMVNMQSNQQYAQQSQLNSHFGSMMSPANMAAMNSQNQAMQNALQFRLSQDPSGGGPLPINPPASPQDMMRNQMLGNYNDLSQQLNRLSPGYSPGYSPNTPEIVALEGRMTTLNKMITSMPLPPGIPPLAQMGPGQSAMPGMMPQVAAQGMGPAMYQSLQPQMSPAMGPAMYQGMMPQPMMSPGQMGMMPQGMPGMMPQPMSQMGPSMYSGMMPGQPMPGMGMMPPGQMGMPGMGMMSPGMGQGMAMGGMMPPGQMGMGGMMSPASMMGQGGLTANPYFPNTIAG